MICEFVKMCGNMIEIRVMGAELVKILIFLCSAVKLLHIFNARACCYKLISASTSRIIYESMICY